MAASWPSSIHRTGHPIGTGRALVTSGGEPGATVHTDGWLAYWTVAAHGYEHKRTVMREHKAPAHLVTPGAHLVASLLGRFAGHLPRAGSAPST